MNTDKKVLTEAERKAKRNEYSRAYYAAHKDKMIAAVRRCQKKSAKKEATAKHAIAPAVGKKTAKDAETKAGLKVLRNAQLAKEKIACKLAVAIDTVNDLKEQLRAATANVKARKADLKAASK